VQDSAPTQKLSEAEASNSSKSVTDHILDFGGQALQEVGAEVVAQVLQNVVVEAPKKAIEAVGVVADGLGSL